jgi:flagellar biosynthesis protein FlhG
MRTDFGVDQADGLRRLLVNNQTRVITLAAGKAGVGRTSVVINLAAALARSGKDVLVLDENAAPNNVLDRLGLYARHDLLDVAQGKCRLGQAMLEAGGFSVLPTARTMHALAGAGVQQGRTSERGTNSGLSSAGSGFVDLARTYAGAMLDQAGQQRLESALTEVAGGVDVILVDAATRSGPVLPSARGTVLLVVVDATASGITESYALIKRLALENARLQFEIVVNKVADEPAARTVFENMAKLARRNLAARLEYLGCIPRDDRLKRATQMGKPVVDAFPTAVSAQSYVGLAHKLLLMPMRQDEAEGAGRNVMHDPMRPASQPQQRFSREIEPVVN